MDPHLPLAAATSTSDVILGLFLVLLAAKIGDEVFKRIGQPAIVGEILAGVLIGPSLLGLVELGEVLEVFAELGVIFLLFWVGLETRISEMRAVGPTALSVGVIGVVLPFAGGLALALGLGEETGTAVFLGAALAATSVGITSAVLIELGLIRTRAARTLLGAAIVDDILALILVAVATGVAAEGGLDPVELAVVIGLALAFVAFFALGGTRAMARRPQLLKEPRFSESPLLPAVILCLGVAVLAAQIGLAAIIGAFLAGLMVAETKEQHPIEDEVAPLYAFFPPFFFVAIGIQLDLGALLDLDTLGLLAAVTVVAAATKLAGAWIGARKMKPDERRLVAIGMIPRGEVGIIVAGIGAIAGVIDEQLFAVIVAMSILTTLVVPPLLRRMQGQSLA
ncbi:MAG TPA: cation:proton antiporter [Solirubrobacterales bacterium]|nr:cation:proton antiporter [Solirubrobacterales bacterium]